MTYTLPSVVLVGPAGSGKSTLAAILARVLGYERLSFAAPLKELAALAYGRPIDKAALYEVRQGSSVVTMSGRRLLQVLGTEGVRAVDEDFWCKAALRGVDGDTAYVVDDCRFPNEEQALRDLGFLFVHLRGRADGATERHVSEEHLWEMVQPDDLILPVDDVPERTALDLIAYLWGTALDNAEMEVTRGAVRHALRDFGAAFDRLAEDDMEPGVKERLDRYVTLEPPADPPPYMAPPPTWPPYSPSTSVTWPASGGNWIVTAHSEPPITGYVQKDGSIVGLDGRPPTLRNGDTLHVRGAATMDGSDGR